MLGQAAGKYGVGLWIFGKLPDRFVSDGYKPDKTLDEKLSLISKIPLVRGVELAYPADFKLSGEDALKNLKNLNLEISAINIDLYSKPKWQKGSITSKDESTRRESINLIKEGIDEAKKLKVKNVILWLGQDGHDYLFADHRGRWRLLVDGLREVAGYLGRETIIYLEYKHKEPRTHAITSNVGKTLHIINRVGSGRLGVTIDTGHALMADENLAESVYIVSESEIPLTLHLNDAYGYWDDDMIVGSVNTLKFLEFFYALDEVGYDGWYDLDIFPYREDPVKACHQSLKIVDYFIRVVRESKEDLREAVEADDPHKSLEVVWDLILKGFH